ncbi:long-chain-fatty-acid--CoA ligase [Peribacillus frigoritolerans]|uniref:long-chain-fatty-acid--CoA ligase n=1 Tax=Peribacillus frigoritolerans TaxID=450367 RepID=UPI00381BB929
MLIPKLLMNASMNHTKKPAFIDQNRVYTYEQLATKAAKVKRSLINMGISHGDRVATLLSNCSEYIEILNGAAAMGAILVPLNTRLSVSEISYILNDAGASTLFVGEEFVSFITEIQHNVPSLNGVIFVQNEVNSCDIDNVYSYKKLLEDQPDEILTMDNLHEDDIAALFYTSGTTGRPKGVMLTHKNLFCNANHLAIYQRYHEEEIYLHAAPMFHIADFGTILGYTLVGATQVNLRSFDTKRILQLSEETRITSAFLIPTMVNMLLNDPDFDKYDTSSLQKIIYGASPMPVEVIKKAAEKLPSVQFIQAYGMTEASPVLTIQSGKNHKIHGTEKELKRLASCGQPIAGVMLKIMTADGTEAAPGEVGEIIARGPNIMKGYWNLPDETSRALRNGWYYTGDVAYRDKDNFYYIVDRAKDMIITGGENVYSIEVEDVLYRHPAVLECAIIGVPHEKWGEAVHAFVVTKADYRVSGEEIIAFVRKYLANYKVPKSIEFLSQLPKTGSGKIFKKELRSKYWKEKERNVN